MHYAGAFALAGPPSGSTAPLPWQPVRMGEAYGTGVVDVHWLKGRARQPVKVRHLRKEQETATSELKCVALQCVCGFAREDPVHPSS